MAQHPLWNDDYWLLLIRLYLKKPVGLKPLYSRELIDLSMELHIPPQYLYEQMFRLRRLDTPRLQHLWETYANNPTRLSRGIKLLRQMHGFGQAADFYQGVEVTETFERDFKPLLIDGYWMKGDGTLKKPRRGQKRSRQTVLTPVMLIMILDLYFRLVPATMVPETPEVKQLARLLKIKPQTVAQVMDVFKYCDPYLNRDELIIDPLFSACEAIWQRYGNGSPDQLAALAAQLKEYFK